MKPEPKLSAITGHEHLKKAVGHHARIRKHAAELAAAHFAKPAEPAPPAK